MKGVNLNGIISIMVAFDNFKQGKKEFWKKMEQLLEKNIKNKR
jgi:hypothetical protein